MPLAGSWSRKALALAALVSGVVAVLAALTVTRTTEPVGAGAADHLDAPGLTPPGGDVRVDITDIYAFRSPANRRNTVLVMNVNGFTKPGAQASFASSSPSVARTQSVTYHLRVDNNGNARPDVDLSVKFGPKGSDGTQSLTLRRNGRMLASGRTSVGSTVGTIRGSSGTRAFAGLRDDPFFFDLDGFINILEPAPKTFIGCRGNRPDKFAKSNVTSIVVELPSGLLTRRGSSQVGVWAETMRGSKQIDRMGRPAIATVFIPSNPFEKNERSLKNAYNKTKPAQDRAKFRSEVVDTLRTLFALNDGGGDNKADDAGKIDGLAGVLLPDVLTFDTAKSAGFLNGRKLADDVIDAELNLITEGAVKTDCVSKNDRGFSRSFPYLAAPHS